MPDFTKVKQKHRVVWASGDYDQIARGIPAVADHVVRSASTRPSERVLDIACGTGNTSLVARARGAIVTGADLTPIAWKRAAGGGYGDITWKEGDAENLPFPDGAFDVVVSSCGLIFALDQQKAVNEVARVTSKDGRIALQAWTREGGVGRVFKVTNEYVPPPSELADTPEKVADLFIDRYGATHRGYHSLTPDGAAAFRKDLIDLYDSYITPADGKVRWGREYIFTLARRA